MSRGNTHKYRATNEIALRRCSSTTYRVMLDLGAEIWLGAINSMWWDADDSVPGHVPALRIEPCLRGPQLSRATCRARYNPDTPR
jgi:hypothetical protein